MIHDITDLLQKRIKCMIRYPDSPFPVGAILTQDFEERNIWHYTDSLKRHFTLEDHNLYPEVFKEIPWYEERDQSQMPEYVRRGRCVAKVDKYFPDNDYDDYDVQLEDRSIWGLTRPITWFLPATLEEYNQYLNQQKLGNKI